MPPLQAPTETNPPFTTPPTWPFQGTTSERWEADYRLSLLEAAIIYMWSNPTAASGVIIPTGTTTGPPTTGTYAAGQLAYDTTGTVWLCMTGGTPGTWSVVVASRDASGNVTLSATSGPTTLAWILNPSTNALNYLVNGVIKAHFDNNGNFYANSVNKQGTGNFIINTNTGNLQFNVNNVQQGYIDPTGSIHMNQHVIAGPPGAAGSLFGWNGGIGILSGAGVPPNANGNDGWYYFRSDFGAGITAIYQRQSGVWVQIAPSPGLPTPVGGASPLVTYTDPTTGDLWIAKGGVNGGAYVRATSMFSSVYRNAAFTAGTGAGNWLQFDTATLDTWTLLLNTGFPGELILPLAGRWQILGNVSVVPAANLALNVTLQYRRGGTLFTLLGSSFHASSTWGLGGQVGPYDFVAQANDQIHIQISNSGAGSWNGQTGPTSTFIQASYEGPSY